MPDEKRLFAATMLNQPCPTQSDLWGLGKNTNMPDKMEVPKDYQGILALCRFFYEHDGLAYTTINKQVEIGINGYAINQGDCSKTEFTVYDHITPLIEEFLRDAALEFLISGLIVPEVTWDVIKGTKISSKLRRSYRLPADLWFRDPGSLTLKRTPLPNNVLVSVQLSEEDILFIQGEGKFPDGTKDPETYKILVEQYPDFVAAVRAGKVEFKLDDPLVLRRYTRSNNVWPTPYLLPALELMLHKRNLRKMDYAIAARVISAIQLFKMGNDEYPLTEDDSELIDDLKAQMRWRGSRGNTERVFQLFSNHTLEIEWVTPEVKALLDEGKYRSINEDILIALGLPRVIVTGEALRSGASNSELALLPPSNTINSMRKQLLAIPREIYKRIKKENNFKGLPVPFYPPIKLCSIKELLEVGKLYYENGGISKTSWVAMGGYDFNTELQLMQAEKKEMKLRGIEERPDVPFAPAPQKNQNNTQQDSEVK